MGDGVGFLSVCHRKATTVRNTFTDLSWGRGRVLMGLGLAVAVYSLSVTLHFHSFWTACFAKGGLLIGFMVLLPLIEIISANERQIIRSLADRAMALVRGRSWANAEDPVSVGTLIRADQWEED